MESKHDVGGSTGQANWLAESAGTFAKQSGHCSFHVRHLHYIISVFALLLYFSEPSCAAQASLRKTVARSSVGWLPDFAPQDLASSCPGIFQTTYAHRHRAFVESYSHEGPSRANFTQEPPLRGSLVFQILEQHSGGLGNRLRALSAVFYLALLTDRAFFVNWTTPEPLERYYVPTAWFDWRASQAPKRLQSALEAALRRPHRWNHNGVVEDRLDLGHFFNSTDFVSLLNHTHEAIFLMYDKSLALVDNYSLEARVKSVLGTVWLPSRRHSLKKPRDRLFGCAMNLLLQPSPYQQQRVRARLRDNLVRVTDWDKSFNLSKSSLLPSHPNKPGWFPIAVHMRLGDFAHQIANADRVKAQVDCLFSTVKAAGMRYLSRNDPFHVYLATDQPTAVVPLIPEDLRSVVWMQDTRHLNSSAVFNMNFGNVPNKFLLTVVDFTVLLHAQLLIASLGSTFASSIARWAWIHPHCHQLVIDARQFFRRSSTALQDQTKASNLCSEVDRYTFSKPISHPRPTTGSLRNDKTLTT